MLVVMEQDASADNVRAVVRAIQDLGYEARPIPGKQRTAVGVVGNDGRIDSARLSAIAGVREIVHITKPYRQVSREWKHDDTVVELPGGVAFGGEAIPVIAGPCAVESEAQILEIAREVRDAGATLLRGGAFKPRTSPYSFQGIGLEGLRYLSRARDETGLLVVTEAMDLEHVDAVEEHCDVIQIGSRNMQNFPLLKRAGRASKPVLLKRGGAATVVEWLLAAEYLLSEGNQRVILCERGIRGYDPTTRNVLDLASVPATKRLSHLPIVVDPSHGTGDRDLVGPMTLAAIAGGADGIMVEVHTHPERSLSDGAQSLDVPRFRKLMARARLVAESVERRLAQPDPVPAGA